ncbi:MAG: anhydro-N-acetylmuramic acid kinase [Methylocystis sp.]|nr:anhydro-N-acetylmuramic acid kinase [Methylocystis sp.]MCA3582905.1 anhydro-N-acetylmuramic acid kinase [Methylocystis sp.]MCA3589202.1 anhydro-N-acetylmuramic acid kinase [Methylocystis sp.]MCA3590663.1 anhydro-N-acetylmuramic acid kinase [Methylocystis sp.]
MAMTTLSTAIGVISGTSMDGIDIALIRTDGLQIVQTGPGMMAPYPQPLRRQLLAFLEDPSRAERDPLTALEEAVTDAFTAAIDGFIRKEGLDRTAIDLIGNHGQTVYHRPEKRFTRQLSLGQRMAAMLGIPVVDDFRTADVKAGGQGAPLVPLYHAALAAGLPQPLMVLNLGGVANVTYLDGETIIAFDAGPASALIDDLMISRFGVPYDDGGRIAREGKVDAAVLAVLMANPFFDARPPKSLDRNDFHLRAKATDRLADHDAAATLTAFTIAATVDALRHVPRKPHRWLVTGGGRHNAHIMQGLTEKLAVPVEPVETVGWNGDLLEAQCFAFLAVRARMGLPLSLPATTGVPRPMSGGRIWKP